MFHAIRAWLGLPDADEPITPARLLGIAEHERNPAAIEQAALRLAAAVRDYQVTHPEEATRLLNEIAWAMTLLLDQAATPPDPPAPPPPLDGGGGRHETVLDLRRGRKPRGRQAVTAIVLQPGELEGAADVAAWSVEIRPIPLTGHQRQKWARRLKGKKASGAKKRPRVYLYGDGPRSGTAFDVSEATWQAFLRVLAGAVTAGR